MMRFWRTNLAVTLDFIKYRRDHLSMIIASDNDRNRYAAYELVVHDLQELGDRMKDDEAA